MNCTVCHHQCKLTEEQIGRCGARKNQNGASVSVNYAQVTSLALDPIEKKPLYRFHPGTSILSAGSFGCNMSCPFCQNHEIAEARPGTIETNHIPPKELVRFAESLRPRGNIGIAFTYNEPMIGFEYVRDSAKLAKEKDLQTAVVTNGCVSQETLTEVLPYIDAFNVDLKCFTKAGYHHIGGDLAMVKAFIETAAKDAHVEVTTLIVPRLSDSEDEMAEMAAWLSSVSADIPYHITRFFPRKHMMNEQPTDLALMRRLQAIAQQHLHFVYLGNV